MTDNEIIKAKEHFKYGISHDIFSEPVLSYAKTVLWAFDEIDRQKAEIERLNIELQAMRGAANGFKADVERLQEECGKGANALIGLMIKNQTVKDEAIKEFAEKVETDLDKRVSKNIRNRNPHWYIAKRIVRETAIEMTEQSVNYESSKRMEGENENH